MELLLLLFAAVLFVDIPITHAVSCISCVSSDDPKCASANYTAPNSFKDCYGSNPCAVSILADSGHTFRGCSDDPHCYDNFEQCETCDGDRCNAAAYPADRMSCLSCSSATDSDCGDLNEGVPNEQYRAACVVHLQEAACVTLFSHYAPVRRACLGDLEPSLRESCELGLPDCVKCDKEYCNVVRVRPDERCLQCDSEDRGCNGGESESSGCGQVSEGKCYARLLNNGTVRRGCFYELTADEATGCNSDTCVVCSGTGCNKNTFVMNRNGSPLSAEVARYLVAIAFAALIVL